MLREGGVRQGLWGNSRVSARPSSVAAALWGQLSLHSFHLAIGYGRLPSPDLVLPITASEVLPLSLLFLVSSPSTLLKPGFESQG